MQIPTTRARSPAPGVCAPGVAPENRLGPVIELLLGLGHSYRLGETLGQSTCGAVWQATWLQTGEAVAVKMLRPGVTLPSERAVHRQALLREAEHLRRLQHRHIVRFQRSGMNLGEPVLVLEQMHESLHQHLQRLPRPTTLGALPCLSPAVALRWARQVALGLDMLHRDGRRHLDLKPANLLLTAPGPCAQRLKIADFGACLGPTVAEHPFFGTPGWVAPEQIRAVGRNRDGEPLFRTDARTDVYALGLLLFALLTGQQTQFSRNTRRAMAGGVLALEKGMTGEPGHCALTDTDLSLLEAQRDGQPKTAGSWEAASYLFDDQPTWQATGSVRCDVGARHARAAMAAEQGSGSGSGSANGRGHGQALANARLVLQRLCEPVPDMRPSCGGAAAALLEQATWVF